MCGRALEFKGLLRFGDYEEKSRKIISEIFLGLVNLGFIETWEF
jgi:hypothetical protein